ncbi:MAG: hypothetical protein R6W77_02145 [Trueperaceae bacterium]
MPRFESIALELLEYKVAEYRATRAVRGGVESMWDLLGQLTNARERLTTDERRRYEEVARTLQVASDRGRPIGTARDLSNLVLEDETADELMLTGEDVDAPRAEETPEERQEHVVLQRVARRVWWDDVDELIQRVAAAWRAERDRYTARIVYATIQNLQRNAERRTFSQDLSLRGFQVFEPIPPLRDPLVSLSDLDSLSEIVRELINLVMTLGRPGSPYPDLAVPEGGALAYLRKAAMAVAANPYAGRMSAIDGQMPSSKQLRLAIQELAKERLPEEERAAQRRALERRLAEVTAWERNERLAFQRDAAMFQDLVHSFFDRLEEYMPTSVGGHASGPQLDGGVLFGINPALRWEKVPPECSALTVRMVGPVRLTLKGHEFQIAGAGNARSLFVDGREIELGSANVFQLGRNRIGIFREGDYVHIRVYDEGRALPVRLAEALVVAYVLDAERKDDLLTTLKVLANSVRGEPQEIVAQAITRATAVSARAPDRQKALDGLLRGAARAAGVALPEETVVGLVTRVMDAVGVDPGDLGSVIERAGAAEYDVQVLTGEPLTIDLAGLKITVRQYRGRSRESQESLVAMLPGQVLGSFTDYLLAPHGAGTLLFARGDQEVAVLHLPATRATAV